MKKKINIGTLYYVLPLFTFLIINFSRETDIWFLFSHGKYILSNGFPHTEFLTMHQGLHFVMQQWVFSTIMYIIYHYLGSIGIVIFVGIINILIIYFLYKLCMKISNNSYFSFLISSIIDILLEINFIIPRPQIMSLLIITIAIYILERKDNSIYFLPLLSIILVNFHSSMWPMLFIVCLPFVAEYLLKKDKSIKKLLGMMILSFLLGYVNPYGLEAMFYSFSSYGIDCINKLVREMHSFSMHGSKDIVYNSALFLFILVILIIGMIKSRKKHSIHSILLLFGLGFMGFMNLRNSSLFFIGAIPYLTLAFSKKIESKISIYIVLICLITIFSFFLFQKQSDFYRLKDVDMQDVVAYLDKNESKDITIYNNYNDGPYLEYHGYKTYIDTRAEIFIKKNNHKKDILEEYYKVLMGDINYNNFINQYHFTHLIVDKDSNIYKYLKKNSDYSKIYNKNNIFVFKKRTY